MKPKKILVALDGSPTAERALAWARALAPRARLVVLRVRPPVHFMGPEAGGWSMAYVMDGAEDYLEKVRRSVRPAPKTVLREGHVATGILDEARVQGCDLIALTTHGGARLLRRVFGGTTEQLLHHTRLPILVVPPSGKLPGPKARVRRIAVPLDGSETAERALPAARALARRLRAKLILVHCLVEPAAEGRVRRHFEGVARRLGAEAAVVAGEVPQVVLEAARARRADLIVMSVHGHGAWKHLFFGSTASKLIREASVPVLALRQEAADVSPRRSLKQVHQATTVAAAELVRVLLRKEGIESFSEGEAAGIRGPATPISIWVKASDAARAEAAIRRRPGGSRRSGAGPRRSGGPSRSRSPR